MENVDRGVFLSYNRSMKMIVKQNAIVLTLRIILPIACLLWMAFILNNSMQTGVQSSAQSSTVVETVQRVAKAIAPESIIANATGESYDKLHLLVRSCAHFAEFAVLGVLFGWCYFAYTLQWKLFFVPTLLAILVAVVDEWIQSFVEGRGWEMIDLLLDGFGGVAGILFAALSVVIGLLIYEKRTQGKVNKLKK